MIDLRVDTGYNVVQSYYLIVFTLSRVFDQHRGMWPQSETFPDNSEFWIVTKGKSCLFVFSDGESVKLQI